MKVLSVFDGMACGMLAMQRAGIKVKRYVAYEIEKYAVQTSTHNFPMIEHRGDVFAADFTEFEGFDFVLAGFPCTKFSIAQKNDRETKPYSGEGWDLFEQAWRAVCEAKPKYFLFENNKSMAKAVQQEISKIVGFEAICINSALVSAQNRQRLYWVGKRNEDGTYSKVPIEQPEDLGILLKDVLECGSGKMAAEAVNTTADGKAQCLRATCYKDGIRNMVGNTIDRKTCVAEPVASMVLNINPSGKGMNGAVGRIDAKSRCMTTNKGEGMKVIVPVGIGYRGRMDNGKWVKQYESNGEEKANALTTCQTDSMVSEPVQVGALPRPNGELSTSQAFRIYDVNAKSVTINANGGGAGGKTGLYAIPVEFEDGIPTKAVSLSDGKTHIVYEVRGGQITIKGKTYPIKLGDGFYIIRKLTVRECMRLQTVPEWYEFPVSDAQAYKMLGNGWTVDVIAHLLNGCIKTIERN